MPLKPGGGNHMQLYDSRNGEYTEQEKQIMRERDNAALASYKWNREASTVKFHFPVEGVHEEDYCRDFVESIRSDLKEPIFIESKMNYLLTYREKDDKSKFLKALGYSENKPRELFHDICVNTRLDSIEFSRFSHKEMLVEGKTILKGKIVKTIWKIEKDLAIKFVSLIPGGYKQWKKLN